MEKLITTSYKPNDVIALMDDATEKVKELSKEEYRNLKKKGIHYSSLLQYEEYPNKLLLSLYNKSLNESGFLVAQMVADLSDRLIDNYGDNLVLISLARAGTPIGVLVKRFIKYKYGFDIPHYTISIIRDIGIDTVAMDYILLKHSIEHYVFLDGWTGKGRIRNELDLYLQDYNIDYKFAVLVDPAGIADICATNTDYVVPSSYLNSIVSGLFSRSILLNDKPKNSLHSAIKYKRYKDKDYTYHFINSIEKHYNKIMSDYNLIEKIPENSKSVGINQLDTLCTKYGSGNIDRIKPGLNETIRAFEKDSVKLLLVNSLYDDSLNDMIELAKNSNVPIIEEEILVYKCCAIVR